MKKDINYELIVAYSTNLGIAVLEFNEKMKCRYIQDNWTVYEPSGPLGIKKTDTDYWVISQQVKVTTEILE